MAHLAGTKEVQNGGRGLETVAPTNAKQRGAKQRDVQTARSTVECQA